MDSTFVAIYSHATPTSLERRATLRTFGSINKVALDGYGYNWSDGEGFFHVFDVARPWRESMFIVEGSKELRVLNNRLYAIGWKQISALDRSNPLQPTVRGTFTLPPGFEKVDELVTTDQLLIVRSNTVVTLLDPDTAALRASIPSPRGDQQWYDYATIAASGTRLVVVTVDTDGVVRIVSYNLSNPDAPEMQGSYVVAPLTPGTKPVVTGLVLDGDRVYVEVDSNSDDSSGALLTLDFVNPAAPTLLSTLAWPKPRSIAPLRLLAPGRLLKQRTNTLTMVDVRQPAQPVVSAPYQPLDSCAIARVQVLQTDDGDWFAQSYGCGQAFIEQLDLRNPAAIQIFARTPSVGGSVLSTNAERTLIDTTSGIVVLGPGPTTAAIAPSGGTITSGRVTASFPAGAFGAATPVTLTEGEPRVNGTIGQLTFTGAAFHLDAASGPTQPYSLTVRYRPTDSAGVFPETLNVYRFDGTAWVREPAISRDSATRTITIRPSAFGWFALLGEGRRTYLPALWQ